MTAPEPGAAAPGQAARYRRRPVSFEVEARQFTEPVDIGELSRWCGGEWFFSLGDGGRVITFPEDAGDYRALPGDWIVKGPDGEFYQVGEAEFAAKYEAIDAVREPQPAAETCPRCGSRERTDRRQVRGFAGPTTACYSDWHNEPQPAPASGSQVRRYAEQPAPALAADAAADATHAFAKDEILANAGPEWDRPLVPETNAIEYVRHLEAEVARLREPQPAPVLAVVTAERDRLSAELDRIKARHAALLGKFTHSGSGYTARMSGVVLARQYREANLPVRDDLSHLAGQ